MKNIALIQSNQFDKIKVMSVSLINTEVNTLIVKISLSTTTSFVLK